MRVLIRGEKMFCPKCGKEVSDDDQFCPNCNAPIPGRVIEAIGGRTSPAENQNHTNLDDELARIRAEQSAARTNHERPNQVISDNIKERQKLKRNRGKKSLCVSMMRDENDNRKNYGTLMDGNEDRKIFGNYVYSQRCGKKEQR